MSERDLSESQLSAVKKELFKRLRDNQAIRHTPTPTIPIRDAGAPIPLTPGQKGLWFLSEMQAAGMAYSVPLTYRITGSLKVDLLIECVNQIIRRHEILHTQFQQQEGEIFQSVIPPLPFELRIEDLHDIPENEHLEHIQNTILAEVNEGFDLTRGPLLKGLLIQQTQEKFILCMLFHHIILDEWSLKIFLHELEITYRAGLLGVQSVLAKPPVQFGDFAIWANEQLNSGNFQPQLSYWRDRLRETNYTLDLPLDRPRPHVINFLGKTITHELSASLHRGLKNLAVSEQVTTNVILLTVFGLILSKYSRQLDILIGTPVANRRQSELQSLIGYFLNILTIRLELDGSKTFIELLQQVNKNFIDALDNQDYPFEQLVQELNPFRDPGRHPLFQVMFVFQDHEAFKLNLPGLEAEYLNLDYGWSKFDLTLFAIEKNNGIEIRAEYRGDLFENETIANFLDHYGNLLQEIIIHPDQLVRNYSILNPSDVEQFKSWNNTVTDYLRTLGVHQLFERWVALTPGGIALEFDNRKMTYQELDQEANRLAASLHGMGVKKNSIIGLCLGRSFNLMVSLLGILKAGATILPLDPDYPQKRLHFMCEDARVSAVITQPELAWRFDQTRTPVILISSDEEIHLQGEELNIIESEAIESYLYVLYTSGSTGQPKGVIMPHKTLVNLVEWQTANGTGDTPALRTIQYTALNFDVAFQEIFTTWSSGGTLVLVGDNIRKDFESLLVYLNEHRIERFFLPFVALEALAEAASRNKNYPRWLREVITAGEQLQITPYIEDLFNHLNGCRLHNHYGPTESHVVTAHTLEGEPASWPRLPPIGKPIANARVHILDVFHQPVPVGLVGEIFLSGECLAQGYLNRETLTRERFTIENILGEPVRIYQTGDLGKYQEDGNIIYLGRQDQQVKIRGFRVEPGEIEVLLASLPYIRQAVVMARKALSGEMQLDAYLVTEKDANISIAGVREELKSQLPDFMIPSRIYIRDSLPLTSTGKIDRRALGDAVSTGLVSETNEERIAPRDELETHLCLIWEKILNTSPIGINQDFFELGGHSLQAVRLFSEIETQLDIRIPASSLFQAPTILQQATIIRERLVRPGYSSLVPIQAAGEKPPFFCVHNFGGFVINYEPLSQALGSEQPFYGLQAIGLDGITPPQTTILEMAGSYLRAIKTRQPNGPYYLGGYCFGGVVAYQIACLMLEQGDEVGLLGLIDAYAPSHANRSSAGRLGRLRTTWKNVPYWLRDFRQMNADERRVVVTRRIRRSFISIQKKFGSSAEMTAKELVGDHANVKAAPDFLQRLMEIHMLALMKYSPPVYKGKVTLFRIQRLPLFTHYDQDLGWGGSAKGGVDLHIIPGAHHNVLTPPYVQGLAYELRTSLDIAFNRYR